MEKLYDIYGVKNVFISQSDLQIQHGLKITLTFFTEIQKTILWFIQRHKQTLTEKAIIVRKSDVQVTKASLKLYGRAKIIETARNCQKTDKPVL